MRHLISSLAVALSLTCPACGSLEESETPAQDNPPASIAPQTFVLRLEQAPTAENILPQILDSARARLTAVCEGRPGASFRIYNPLLSGDFADVPCAALLDGDGPTGQAQRALSGVSGEGPLGEARQPLGGPACLLAGLALAWASRFSCARHPEDRTCTWGAGAGTTAFAIACFLF